MIRVTRSSFLTGRQFGFIKRMLLLGHMPYLHPAGGCECVAPPFHRLHRGCSVNAESIVWPLLVHIVEH